MGRNPVSPSSTPYAFTPNSEQGAVWPPRASTLSRHQHWLLSQLRATHLHLYRGIMRWFSPSKQAPPRPCAAQEPAIPNTNILKEGGSWEGTTEKTRKQRNKAVGWEVIIRWGGQAGLLRGGDIPPGPERQERVTHGEIWGKTPLGRGNDVCEGMQVRTSVRV